MSSVFSIFIGKMPWKHLFSSKGSSVCISCHSPHENGARSGSEFCITAHTVFSFYMYAQLICTFGCLSLKGKLQDVNSNSVCVLINPLMLLSNTVSLLKMQNTSLRSALPIKSNGSLLSGSSQFWQSEQYTADIKHCELQRERESIPKLIAIYFVWLKMKLRELKLVI